MAYETITYEGEDQILTLTLNRPDKLKAFTGQMMREMIDAFDLADKDDDIRAIIVTGAGRGFCAGADLSSGADTFARDARRGEARPPCGPQGRREVLPAGPRPGPVGRMRTFPLGFKFFSPLRTRIVLT